MYHVFISYSSKDVAQAEMIKNILKENNITAWMAPADIPGGSNYTKEIPVAIRNSQAFLLVLSPNAQSSKWVLKELDMAVNEGKVILPFMLEDFLLNDEFNFLLTGAQRYAAYQKKAEAIQNLINRLQRIIDVESDSQESSDTEEEINLQAKHVRNIRNKDSVVVCPNCGGDRLKKHIPKIKCKDWRDNVKRVLYFLLSLALSYVYGFIAIFIITILYTSFSFNYQVITGCYGIILIASTIYGVYTGRMKASEYILNKEGVRAFKCKGCGHVFLSDKPDETILIVE